jgi:hypothetical protein
MPPLTSETERYAPRATGFCIDERHVPGRSRSQESSPACQGSNLSASLAPRSWHEQRLSTPTEPQAPGMLDEPTALFPCTQIGRSLSQMHIILGERRTPTFRFCSHLFNERGRSAELCAGQCMHGFTSKNIPSYLSAANVARNLSDGVHSLCRYLRRES